LGVAESLVGVAAAIAVERAEDAARLAGAAGALFHASAAVPTPRQQADLDAVSQLAMTATDAGTVAAAVAAGAVLHESAAVAAALDGSAGPSATSRTA
jgi:hypothetical protein